MTRIKRQSEKRRSLKNKLSVVLIICVVLLSGYFARNSFAKLTHLLLFPLQETFSLIKKPFKNIPAHFSSKKVLIERNYELSERNKKLEIEVLSTKSIRDQNRELKKILDIRDTDNELRILGRVILIPPFSPFDTFVVRLEKDFVSDQENEENLVGKPVYIMNVLVGEIQEVYNKNAIIKLYSSYGEKLSVKINNEILAEAEGTGGLSFKSSIPKTISVEEKMPIFAVEHPDVIIGVIEDIQVSETSSFQTIYFQYPFNYSNFIFVEIRN